MPLSWNEIRANAMAFSKEWEGESREHAEAKSFWDAFFGVFGLRRRNVAAFEAPVKKLSGQWGYIDLFWAGTVIVEHKSRGKSLDTANTQAMEYIRGLIDSGRQDEVPRYVIVSDFERMALHDLEAGSEPNALGSSRSRPSLEFPLREFHKHIHAFAFIPGYKRHVFASSSPLDLIAAKRLGLLRDSLEDSGYTGHALERLLVRLLFCLFADKTSIFDPKDAFSLYLINHTKEDGSDLGIHLQEVFDILDTPVSERSRNLPEDIRDLRYVNGGLFAERLNIAHFDRATRDALIHCARFDWSAISPAIFGALFQSVIARKERRQIGAHYTSERDIMKVVGPLFLDELRSRFEKAKGDSRRLEELRESLSRIRILDPACGCGNFLVVSYRELRQLEIDILKALHVMKGSTQTVTDIAVMARVDVDQFYGIEIEEWPARIAEVAMWLMDHQMNIALGEEFGGYYPRFPLAKSPTIVNDNALRRDWSTILQPSKCSYVLGNPPFVGKKEQSAGQKADMRLVWDDYPGAGVLDYVTCWYLRAAEYIQNSRIGVAFVSTNSISQGEQVGVLWSRLFQDNVKIHFAHRTFAWQSEASGKAHVHVVIIGFGAFNSGNKVVFDYDEPRGEPHAHPASNIGPYLTDASDITVKRRTKAIGAADGAPRISYGSMMIDKPRDAGDDEGLLITDDERKVLLAECLGLKPFLRKAVGGEEFINGTFQWCLWLEDAPPSLLRESPRLRARIDKIRRFRLASDRPQTKKLADLPALFGERRQPSTEYLLIPKVSSETRRYVPMGFVKPEIIATGSALVIPGASHYDFGILSSAMHNAWVRAVGGRMKSDYQYSNQIVYNTFPWPENVTSEQKKAVEDAARLVLHARKTFAESETLASMYDPSFRPKRLRDAHQQLDRAVDRCYRKASFASEFDRLRFLLERYGALVSPLGLKAQDRKIAAFVHPKKSGDPSTRRKRSTHNNGDLPLPTIMATTRMPRRSTK